MWEIDFETVLQVSAFILQSRKLSSKKEENTQRKNAVENEAKQNLGTLQAKRTLWENKASARR